MFCIRIACVAATLVLGLTALAQRDFAQVEIKAIPVSGGVHMLEGAGGNIGVSVGDDGGAEGHR